MEQEERQPEKEPKPSNETVCSIDLLFLTRAYNRKDITFEEWLKLTKKWAEAVIKQYGEGY